MTASSKYPMDRREIADLTARLYLVRTGVPYGVAMMLSPESRDIHLDILIRLNGDGPVDDGAPTLTLIDLEAERTKLR